MSGVSYDVIKRGLDAAAAFVLLIVTAPVMCVVALLVALRLGRPVLFRQARPGCGGEHFMLVKFRTMRDVDESQGLVSDADRLTPLGRALRLTSLDELPELWNVLRGQMSMIGPRPLLPRYTAFFSERERLRLTVRPGITGWAQVNGRNHSSWDARLEMDVWYVEHRSLRLDGRIVALTLKRMLRPEGVVADPRSVMRDLDVERAGGA